MLLHALSRKPRGIVAALMIREWQALETIAELNLQPAKTEKRMTFWMFGSTTDTY